VGEGVFEDRLVIGCSQTRGRCVMFLVEVAEAKNQGPRHHHRVNKHTSTHFAVLQSVFGGHVVVQVSGENMACITIVDHYHEVCTCTMYVSSPSRT